MNSKSLVMQHVGMETVQSGAENTNGCFLEINLDHKAQGLIGNIKSKIPFTTRFRVVFLKPNLLLSFPGKSW